MVIELKPQNRSRRVGVQPRFIRSNDLSQNVRFCYRGRSAHGTIISRPRPIFTSRVQAFSFPGRSLHRSAYAKARTLLDPENQDTGVFAKAGGAFSGHISKFQRRRRQPDRGSPHLMNRMVREALFSRFSSTGPFSGIQAGHPWATSTNPGPRRIGRRS